MDEKKSVVFTVANARTLYEALSRIKPATLYRGDASLGAVKLSYGGGMVALSTWNGVDTMAHAKVEAVCNSNGDAVFPLDALRRSAYGYAGRALSVSLSGRSAVDVIIGSLVRTLPTMPRQLFDSAPHPYVEDQKLPDLSLGEASELGEAIAKVMPMASSDTTRPYLAGVAVATHEGHLCVFATDGHRMAAVRLGQSSPITPFIIGNDPSASLVAMLRHCKGGKVRLRLSEGRAVFLIGGPEADQEYILCPRSEENVPYSGVFGYMEEPRIEERKLPLSELLAAAGLATKNVLLAFSPGVLMVSEWDKQGGPKWLGRVAITGSGHSMTVGVNPRYLLDALSNCDAAPDGTVSISLAGSELDPVHIRGVSAHHVVMPVRI